MSTGTKHDTGKPPMDLLPHESLVEVAKVLAFGEKKYSAGNWAKGIEYRRLISAAQRHLGDFNAGIDKDEESGLSHLAHAACCLLFLLYMEKKRPDLDNRWAKAEAKPVVDGSAKHPLKIEVGKSYRDGTGEVHKIVVNPYGRISGFPFASQGTQWTYTSTGKWDGETTNSKYDLIEEIK